MGQNVTIAGASYPDVPALDVPKTGGGTARFVDTADDTVTPATLKSGVTAHDASGAKITGTLDTTPPEESDINFWDYDGTLLYAWTLAELATKTELPPLPSHDGLICQGWNWTLAEIKAEGHEVDVGTNYITDDGKTRIYIHLEEGRTSPMLGICPNGTLTVDWGDGTTPDTLTGTSTTAVKWTPAHAYTAPGNYVIKLTVDGTFGFYGTFSADLYGALLRHSASADKRNMVYRNAIRRVEIGSGIAAIADNAFNNCFWIAEISLPRSIARIGNSAFYTNYSLKFAAIPSGASIDNSAFTNCFALSGLSLPATISAIPNYMLNSCFIVGFGATPGNVQSLGVAAYQNNYSRKMITLPASLSIIPASLCVNCYSLAQVIVPSSVASIGAGAFQNCYGVKLYDFSKHTAVPTLANANAFTGIAADCEIRVPASLADSWKAATNWSTLADHIVGVST